MPGKYHHQMITRQALKSAGVSGSPLLIEEYSSYPDNVHRRYEEISPYLFVKDDIEFHYPPHTPVDQFYRYWNCAPGQGTFMVDREENGNVLFAEAGFKFYAEHFIAAFKQGEIDEAWKFLGCLLHFLEDSAFGIHAFEGPDGTDIYVLDRMSGKNIAKYICSIPLDEAVVELTVEAQIIASDIEEFVARLYCRYVEATAVSRRAVFDMALEHLTGKGENTLAENQRTMFLSAVQLAADCIATLMAICEDNAAVEKQRKLSEFTPFYYPIGGGGSFQLRRYEVDGNDFVFGVNLEARLLFDIPAIYRSFRGRIVSREVENTSVEVINNGEVQQSFKLDGNADIDIEVENPGGVFGVKVRAPRGKGELTFADGVFFR